MIPVCGICGSGTDLRIDQWTAGKTCVITYRCSCGGKATIENPRSRIYEYHKDELQWEKRNGN